MAEGDGLLWDHAASDLRSNLAEAGHVFIVDCCFSGDVEARAHHPGITAAAFEPFDGPCALWTPASVWVPIVDEVPSGPQPVSFIANVRVGPVPPPRR